jgi:CBS-domain-containing membrane protein
MVIVFVLFPNEDTTLGIIDLSSTQYAHYKSPRENQTSKKKIDADRYLKKIIATTDMSSIKAYTEAVKLENDELYRLAREKYKEAYIAIRHHADMRERMKQKIIINYRLMKLAFKEQAQNDTSIKEYKDLLKHEIGIYVMTYSEE